MTSIFRCRRCAALICSAACISLIGCFSALADDLSPSVGRSQTVVVTATRVESDEKDTPGSFSVIDATELARKQSASVSELLREVPGLSLSNQGGAGQTTSVFVRGTNPEHVLVLIDGVKVNDPLHPGRAFDFGNLGAGDLERIEILRGPGSVLYGSDAMGGVIQIFTKKGKGRVHTSVESEIGAYESLSARASIRGEGARGDYALAGGLERAAGFSAANEAAGNTEKDGRTSWQLNGRAGVEALPGIRAELNGRFTQSTYALDAAGGPGGDDPNWIGESREFEGRLTAKPAKFRTWEPVGALTYSHHQRRTDNEPDQAHPERLHGIYDSSRVQAQWQNNFYLADSNTLVAGVEFESEFGLASETGTWGENTLGEQAARTAGVFFQNQQGWGALRLTVGSRMDWHERYGWVATYRLAPSYDLLRLADRALTLKSSVGTGFKAPSLYQLHAPIYGNVALQPERNLGYELGVAWEGLSVTWFNNRLENLITGAAPNFVYQNVGRARTDGLELGASAKLSDGLSLAGSYTFTRTLDETTNLELLRRPSQQASAELALRPVASVQLSLGGRFVGVRQDLDAVNFARKEMAPYFVARAAARWNMGNTYRVVARIENLLDARYEEIDGYGTPGRSVFVGVGAEL